MQHAGAGSKRHHELSYPKYAVLHWNAMKHAMTFWLEYFLLDVSLDYRSKIIVKVGMEAKKEVMLTIMMLKIAMWKRWRLDFLLLR